MRLGHLCREHGRERHEDPDARPGSREPTEVEQCANWLVCTLLEAGEPLKPKEVIELADEEGWGRATVYRARDLMGDQIVNTAGKKSPNNRWTLANMIADRSQAGDE